MADPPDGTHKDIQMRSVSELLRGFCTSTLTERGECFWGGWRRQDVGDVWRRRSGSGISCTDQILSLCRSPTELNSADVTVVEQRRRPRQRRSTRGCSSRIIRSAGGGAVGALLSINRCVTSSQFETIIISPFTLNIKITIICIINHQNKTLRNLFMHLFTDLINYKSQIFLRLAGICSAF